jgi:ubiquitin carboxyl-terminal hydrolase 36/42
MGCSKHDVKTEGAAASQNNGLPSMQKALGPQNDSATMLTKSRKALGPQNDSATMLTKSIRFAATEQTVTESSSGKQPVTERSPREVPLKANKMISIAATVVSGAAKLPESDEQTTQPQTIPFSKPIADENSIDTWFTTQTSSNKDAVVSNDVMPNNGCVTSHENVKDLQESLEPNKTSKSPVSSKSNIAPELSQVDGGKQICSGGSVQVVIASSCNGSMVKKVILKQKKLVRYPIVNMWLGSRQLLVASLKLGKKTKHKRTRRRSLVCNGMPNIACLGDSMNEQLTSTSATAPSETVECNSRRRKHAHATPSPKVDTQPSENRQKVAGACSGAGTGATTDSSDLLKLDPSSSMDQTQSKKNADAKLGVSRTVSIRAADLMEATVPCWDDIDVPSTKTVEPQHSKRSIGYVLDEQDEEYDRGKMKKIRGSKDDFDGSNPFQEKANYLSQQHMKQKSYQGKSCNKPNRFHMS